MVGITAHVGESFPLSPAAVIGPGCNLEVNNDVLMILGQATTTGTRTLPLVIPNTPSLAGSHAYFQYGYTFATRSGVTKGLDVNLQTK